MNRRTVFALVATLGVVALSASVWGVSVLRTPRPAQAPVEALPTPTEDPPAIRTLRVTVHDAEAASPLAGAQVNVDDRQGSTDAGGAYAIDVPGGTLPSVQVTFPGYEPWAGSADATDKGADAILLDVPLQPNTVRGQVVGPGLVPLPDAAVRFDGKLVPLDDEGRFVLRRVSIGDPVTAEHPRHLPRSATFDGYPTLYLTLEPASVIVRVRDAMVGQEIPEAQVCITDEQCQSTDASGQATLRQVMSGLTVSIQRPGYGEASVTYQGEGTLDVQLTPEELYGVVRDLQSGEPLTNTILLVDEQLLRVDERGRFHLTGLGNIHSLFVKSPGHKRVEIGMDTPAQAGLHDALDACLEPDRLPCADINLPRFAVRGIYASYNLLVWDRPRMLELIDMVDRSPMLNAIVVDIKGDFGYLVFQSDDPIIAPVDAMATPRLPVPEFLQLCKEKHIYAIARMVIFKDSPLVKARPELAVRHPNGAIFYDREGMAWADPTREEVWEYNIAITREAIRLGFDEIQYDYLRYPSDSTSLEVVRALVYSVPSTTESRTQAIEGFVTAAKAAVDPTRAFLSADLFGYALSVQPDHDMRIGQRLKDLAPHVDYVCPMVYPSTFIPGNLGLASPTDSPYDVVAISMDYGMSRTSTILRPWLQHYWYDRHEIAEQWRAAEEATDAGWCFWNARGQYDELFFVPPEGLEP